MSEILDALSSAINVVLESVTKDLQSCVSALREVDAAYMVAVQQHSETAAMEALLASVVPRLQLPTHLATVDFASSLVSMERPFFSAFLGVMARDVEKQDPPHILVLIGGCRRNKGYSSMHAFCQLLDNKLKGDESPGAYGFRSTSFYELHMAAYQQAGDVQGREAQVLYQSSRELALKSAAAADLAGDPYGRLFAEMNISGLILPKMGRWEEGYRMSERVSSAAAALAAEAADDEAKKRALRIMMNCDMHRIEMLVQNNGRKGAIEALLAKLDGNPVFLAAREHPDVAAGIAIAQRYISV